jgi:hypothetical protein
MKRMAGVLHEVLGLFVDDGVFAAAIAAWPAIVWFAVARFGVPRVAASELLFAGLVAILVVGAVRYARPTGP